MTERVARASRAFVATALGNEQPHWNRLSPLVLLAILGLGLVGWYAARSKARLLYSGRGSLHSTPGYHGWHMALWVVAPALLTLALLLFSLHEVLDRSSARMLVTKSE